MWWRIRRSEFNQNKGEGNRQAFKAIVDSGQVPGILAYHDTQPVGWCSVSPREDFPALYRSPLLKPIDSQQVWSIVCFYIDKPARKQGLSDLLIEAAVEYARRSGARIIEAYPKDIRKGVNLTDTFLFTGLVSAFTKAGFVEVARRSETRPIMRYIIKD